MNRQLRPPARLSCLLSLVLMLSLSPASADGPAVRVLILPLTIHAENDLTFLSTGIMEMMTARIGRAASVVRGPAPAADTDPRQAGLDREVDYVVSGSLTVFGATASTDATLTRIDTGEAVLRFSRLGRNRDTVLADIDRFATQVGDYLATLPGYAPPLAVPTPAAPLPTPLPPAPPAAADQKGPIRRAHPFSGVISALAAGDVDGDGAVEVVVAHDGRILIQKGIGDRPHQQAAFDTGARHTLVALDVADINRNRRAEIFVTRLDAGGRLDAVVLEWNGTALRPLADRLRWYFRVHGGDAPVPTLLGQRQGARSPTDTGGLYTDPLFLPGVFEMAWDGETYQAGPRLPLPAEVDVYRFTPGDVFNDRTTRYIAYASDDTLRVYDSAGASRWSGEEPLGGSPRFLQRPSLTDARTPDRTYLAPRLTVADLDGDGLVEVITVHNRDVTRGVVERFRHYTRGRMIALRWDRLTLRPVWAGEEVDGYISDFSLADLNGDGRPEAVFARVTGAGVGRAGSSHIVVEPIGELSPD